MRQEITYKKQGNGSDSWRVKKFNGEVLIADFMVYENPYIVEVELWKLKGVLSALELLPQIEAAIQQLEEPNKTFALMSWNHGNTISSNSPTVKFIQTALNLSDAQVGDIFNEANN